MGHSSGFTILANHLSPQRVHLTVPHRKLGVKAAQDRLFSGGPVVLIAAVLQKLTKQNQSQAHDTFFSFTFGTITKFY